MRKKAGAPSEPPVAPAAPATIEVSHAAAAAAFAVMGGSGHVDDPMAGVAAMKAGDGTVNLAVRQPDTTYLSYRVRVPATMTFEIVE